MFIIGRSHDKRYISKAAFPPRLSEWTTILNRAEQWEHQSEAQDAADYIKKAAWNVVVLSSLGTSLHK